MKYLTLIWNFLNSKLFSYILIVLVVFFLINFWNKSRNLKEDLERKDHNIEVLNDSIKTVKLKNGDLESSIGSYKATAKELEEFNKRLTDQIKAEKGKVITFGNLVFRLRQDSIRLQKELDSLKAKYETPVQVNDSTWNVDWTLPYIYDSLNYDIYKGRTQVVVSGNILPICLEEIRLKHNKTWMLNRDSQMNLTWGQKEVNGKLLVFARTAHPAFQAKLLEGVYVDYPHKDHWFTGFGVGPQLGIGYNFIQSEPVLTIGVGITYNVYHW